MSFKATWEDDKNWKILSCDATCGLVGGDVLAFSSQEDGNGLITSVEISCTRVVDGIEQSWPWAQNCTYIEAENRVTGENDLLESFSIHWNWPQGAANPLLVCAYATGENGGSGTVLEWCLDVLIAFIHMVISLFTGESSEEPNGGSGGGSWTAEEGSNGNAVTPLQMAV